MLSRSALLAFNLAAGVSASLGLASRDGSGTGTQQPMAISAAEGRYALNGVCRLHAASKSPAHQFASPSFLVSVPSPPLDIRPLVVSGPPENRVDLVFFSDGYTAQESDKFFADAMRLADDVSRNQTFFTVKPLLNFWGAFTASEESGIGVGGVPKNTVFGLYRDGTELRGVYYDKPEVAHAACDSMQHQCDYPILLGNDPYYGGLGGEFTVITSSVLNGQLVLRHELGHSIIEVGEEYDGGFAYFGVNAAHNLSEPVPWAHWLTERNSDPATHRTSDGSDSILRSTLESAPEPRVERSVMPIQTYPWTLLNTTDFWSIKFISSGAYARHLVRFSLSGLPEASDLRVELDGVDLKWTPRKDLGLDRWHYDIHRNSTLKGGEHELKFILLNSEREGIAQLCSAEILEFGDENEFISTPGNYGIYPTFSDKNETSYRPTNEDCLMRIVTTPNFCKVCTEGLWLSLLKRVNLIDGFAVSCSSGSDSTWTKTLQLDLVPLAHLRETASLSEDLAAASGIINNEAYTITWKKDGLTLDKFTNHTSISIADDQSLGRYTVAVTFSTDQVRVDKEGLLSSSVEYDITGKCSDSE